MRLPWRRSEYERRVAAMQRDVITLQITLNDRMTPVLRRVAVKLEVMMDAADGRWNRHQMIGDLG